LVVVSSVSIFLFVYLIWSLCIAVFFGDVILLAKPGKTNGLLPISGLEVEDLLPAMSMFCLLFVFIRLVGVALCLLFVVVGGCRWI